MYRRSLYITGNGFFLRHNGAARGWELDISWITRVAAHKERDTYSGRTAVSVTTNFSMEARRSTGYR